MIVPIGINHVIRRLPLVTVAIIATCTLVHIYATEFAPSPKEVLELAENRARELPADHDDPQLEQKFADEVEQLANRIPWVRFGYHTGSGVSWRLLTSAFVHGGWLHLIGNMLFLWLAGAALEDRWGKARFAALYVAGAVASAGFFALLHSGPETTLIGASGAISALMGAFLVFFTRMQIYFAYWFGIRAGTFQAVAYVALPLWFGEQLFDAWLASDARGMSTVAFTAHIGGFLFGLAVALVAKVVARPADEPARVPRATARPAKPEPPRPKLEPVKVEPPKPEPPSSPDGGPRFLG